MFAYVSQLVEGGADGVQYLRDAVLTLCMLLTAYPPAAQLLLNEESQLVATLASLHSQLVPQIVKAMQALHAGVVVQQVGYWRLVK